MAMAVRSNVKALQLLIWVPSFFSLFQVGLVNDGPMVVHGIRLPDQGAHTKGPWLDWTVEFNHIQLSVKELPGS